MLDQSDSFNCVSRDAHLTIGGAAGCFGMLFGPIGHPREIPSKHCRKKSLCQWRPSISGAGWFAFIVKISFPSTSHKFKDNMKFSAAVAVGALAAGVVSAADETREVVTVTVTGSTDTHRYGRFDKTKDATTSTSSGTHRYGRFDKTKDSTTSTSSGTHRYGRFDKTKKESTSTNSGTHRYGRFDKTKKETTSTSSGTHRYGRFDKTKDATTSTSSGTHKYGRFDKTKQPLTTTVYVSASDAPIARAVVNNGSTNATTNGTNGTNGSHTTSADSGAALLGSGVTLGFAGAVAAGLLLI
ncbi:hypothetical protein OXX79_002099 [Metschnikowia pulcherrima]